MLEGIVQWSASQLHAEGFLRDGLLVFQSSHVFTLNRGFSLSYCKLAQERNPQLYLITSVEI